MRLSGAESFLTFVLCDNACLQSNRLCETCVGTQRRSPWSDSIIVVADEWAPMRNTQSVFINLTLSLGKDSYEAEAYPTTVEKFKRANSM